MSAVDRAKVECDGNGLSKEERQSDCWGREDTDKKPGSTAWPQCALDEDNRPDAEVTSQGSAEARLGARGA